MRRCHVAPHCESWKHVKKEILTEFSQAQKFGRRTTGYWIIVLNALFSASSLPSVYKVIKLATNYCLIVSWGVSMGSYLMLRMVSFLTKQTLRVSLRWTWRGIPATSRMRHTSYHCFGAGCYLLGAMLNHSCDPKCVTMYGFHFYHHAEDRLISDQTQFCTWNRTIRTLGDEIDWKGWTNDCIR